MTRSLFLSLCGLVFLVNFGRTAFAPLNEPLRAAFGVGPGVVGTVISLVWLGSAVPRIPVGYALTRVPRHRVVVAAGLSLAAAAAFAATATSVLRLQLGAFAIGVASGAYFVAAVPLVSELYPEARGRAIGVHGTASQLAAVFAPGIVLGVLLLSDWRGVFWLLAAAALLSAAAVLAVVRGASTSPGTGADRDFRSALAHWRLMVVGILFVGIPGFAWQGVFNFLVPYLAETKGFTPGTANTALTALFAAGVPAFWFGGRFADRFPHVPTLLGVQLSFLSALVALTLVQSTWGVFLVVVALGFIIHAIFPVVDTYMLDRLPAGNRASVYAVFSGVSLAFEANGSGALGWLTGAGVSYDAAFRAAAAFVLAGFLLLSALALADRLPEGPDDGDRGVDADANAGK